VHVDSPSTESPPAGVSGCGLRLLPVRVICHHPKQLFTRVIDVDLAAKSVDVSPGAKTTS
jgi:hypothetical protein